MTYVYVGVGMRASGYGIWINEETSAAKNYVYTKFDKKRNELAAKLLKNTKKKDSASIEVRGIKDGQYNYSIVP
jgi:hypothetical protein